MTQIVAHYRAVEPEALVSNSAQLPDHVSRIRAEREACNGDRLAPPLALLCRHLGQHHGL
jgi:hypothetical protein